MNIEIQPLAPAEYDFSYGYSPLLLSIAGCIGDYIETMEAGVPNESTWTDRRKDLKAEDFQPDFDAVLDALRNNITCGGILAGPAAAHAYCRAHPESAMDDLHYTYGFRINTEKYAYILRLMRVQASRRTSIQYIAVIFCYLRERLDGLSQWANNDMRGTIE